VPGLDLQAVPPQASPRGDHREVVPVWVLSLARPFGWLVSAIVCSLLVTYLASVAVLFLSKDPDRREAAETVLRWHPLAMSRRVRLRPGRTPPDIQRTRPMLERAETDPPDWESLSGYDTAMVRFTDGMRVLVHLTARRAGPGGQWWFYFWWGDSDAMRGGWYRYDPEHMTGPSDPHMPD
jgi:hypothetical protein